MLMINTETDDYKFRYPAAELTPLKNEPISPTPAPKALRTYPSGWSYTPLIATTTNGMFPQKLKISDNVYIGPQEKCFIIAEIGQNHQGDLDTAKALILAAKESGADCVKFQKSNLPAKFNKKALTKPYTNPNSWGMTYGDHKKHLEFTNEDFIELFNFSSKNKIIFSSSAMDDESLIFLNSLNLPFLKIGSGDFHNKILLKKAMNFDKPLVISTGMSNLNEVADMYSTLKSKHLNFCFLHCVSSYPTPVGEVNLNVIKTYQKLFPDVNIGYSGHEIGINVSLAAVALGAKVIERHFTLNKAWKGSDHICSLTPSEFKKLVSSIRKLEAGEIDPEIIFNKQEVQEALGDYEKKFQNSEMACFEKLGKSVVAVKRLQPGEVITWENICLKVAEPKGVFARDVDSIIGKKLKRLIEIDESILQEDVTDA